jgi:phenylalanyl-tRNA synthetase beta chain
MKISWNWLREILPTQIDVNKAAEILTDIGLEVEAIVPYESVRGGLQNLIVGEVLTCEKHPDADKLKLTKVNIGKEVLLNIVCGAPNVAAGQKVIVAQIGTTIYPINKEPFTIKKAKIRGVESEGMLCAEDEIGLGENHAGIHLLPDEAIVGSKVKNYFDVYEDTIIEIGLTANHADANSHYGVARELYAALKSRGIEKNISLNDIHKIAPKATVKNDTFQVTVEDYTKCPRYAGICIQDVTIQESPKWLQNKLKAIGMRPINTIVDITNYILHEYGQPLHAFDADTIASNKIIVKTLHENTSFITLDDKERKLAGDDLMICDAEKGLCIAGVYGGKNSGITNATKNIFLESAYFDPASIRKTEAEHGLKTEASARFAKGTDPEMTVTALQKAASLIIDICKGNIASDIFDIYPEKIQPAVVFLRYARLELIAAIKIEEYKIIEILELLNIKVVEKTPEGLQLEVPPCKNDVLKEIDVIEEILRMYGYNTVPLPASVKMPYRVSEKADPGKLKSETKRYLANTGFYELFTNGISRSKYAKKYLHEQIDTQVKLLNSLNDELDCMRQSLLFSGMEVIALNLNRKHSNLKLFELGKTYYKVSGEYKEIETLALFVTGNITEENWHLHNRQSDIFDLKAIVTSILQNHHLNEIQFLKTTNSMLEGAAIVHKGSTIGLLGSVQKSILTDFDIKQQVFYAELYCEALFLHALAKHIHFKEIPKYPEMRRDLALILTPETTYEDIKSIALHEGKPILKDITLFDIYEGEKLNGKKSYAIGLTFRDDDKTLVDKDVDTVLHRMVLRYEKELGAVIRKN